MATPKEIKNRISAVQNTKKITRTMEMVATAKSKRAVDRVNESILYSKKLNQLTSDVVSDSTDTLSHPLLRHSDTISKAGLLVISGDRGLCGGFNNNVIKSAQEKVKTLASENMSAEIHLIGKKTIHAFKFAGIAFSEGHTHIEDKPSYQEASEIADFFIQEFSSENIDRFEIISTRYISSSFQAVRTTPLLPMRLDPEDTDTSNATSNKTSNDTSEKETHGSRSPNFLFEPSPAQILASLLPLYVRMTVFQAMLESAASEQIARRIAMKNATENASEIIRDLTLVYNRARQAKITQEIAELVGGAAAIG